MIPIEILDPASPDDPAFDPHGAQGRRVLQAALARVPEPSPRASRRVRQRLALASLAVCAAAGVAAAVLSGTSAPDAAAALQRAARATAATTSGQVIYTERVRTAALRSDGRWEIRFDGDDLAATMRGQVTSGGSTRPFAETYVEVAGVGYLRDDSGSTGGFRRLQGEPSDVDLPHRLVEHVGNTELVELVRSADDLTSDQGQDGNTIYRATASSGAVFDAAPTAAGRLPTASSDAQVAVEVTVGPDGRLRRVVVDREGATATIEYRRLGEDQDIREP